MNLIRHSAARDLRVDFFRGLALWWIYTDHIPGDVLGDYSLRNFATCDATEVFVLLAGYGAGLSYGMGLGRNGYISTAADVLKRAWTLYIAHIFLFVLFTAQVTYSATAMNRLNYLSETRLDVLGDDPYRSMLEAVLLRFQPSLLNILPLYVVLLVFFAATIWMLRWPRLLFGFSLAIYLLVRVTGLNLDSWDEGGWFFDPLAWQFLFIIGVLLACAPMPLPKPHLAVRCRRRRGGRSGRGRDGGDRALSASARNGVPLGVPVAGGGRQDQPVSAPADLDPGADLAVRPADPLRCCLAAVALGRAAGAARTEFTAGVLLRHRLRVRRPAWP